MQDHVAPAPEFGTGLRARLERLDRAHQTRGPAPTTPELIRLCADEPSPPPPAESVRVAADLTRRGAHGAFAA